MVYTHNGILFGLKKEQSPDIDFNMGELRGHQLSEIHWSQEEKYHPIHFHELWRIITR